MEHGREDGARKNFWKIYLCQLFFLRLSLRWSKLLRVHSI